MPDRLSQQMLEARYPAVDKTMDALQVIKAAGERAVNLNSLTSSRCFLVKVKEHEEGEDPDKKVVKWVFAMRKETELTLAWEQVREARV